MPRDRLDVRLTDLAAASRFRGALRVERGDSVLIDAAYGTDGAGNALAPGTAFQIASISKSFTAASVLFLVDDGRISIDDPLTSFIAALPTSRDVRAPSPHPSSSAAKAGTRCSRLRRRSPTRRTGSPTWATAAAGSLHEWGARR